ncbi:MAG: adenosylmethionine--8-amino-7-oxononanoate transaminase [Burkholderiales bacterium]|nr:adenosylmethionine--8-amino-7-oxononanoate transaminase [Burkholderiales bacterium]
MTDNSDLLARSLRAVWHPCTQMKLHESLPLLPLSRGEGVWLYDFGGRRYLDAISSWWVNIFGHANARINAALTDQLGRLEHAILAGCTHEPVVTLAERLAKLAPGRLGHCFFASDGASATEIALKMSFHYWRNRGEPAKTQFVSLARSYHGETLGALSVTDVALFKDVYAPLLRGSVQVPSPDWRLRPAGSSPEQHAAACAEALEQHLSRHHANIAALIIEPLVQGACGMGMYAPLYLKRARELCTRHGVLLIADEIMTGFGRTGSLFACEQAGIAPDLLCLSKALTGGYLPLSVVMTSDAIYDAFYADEVTRGFLHSHSYTGNALACRAALATLDIFDQDDVIASNRRKSQRFSLLAQPLAGHPRVRDFRNQGMIWAFEVESDDPAFARKFHGEALERGLLLRPIGNTVYFMPPYVMEEGEWRLLVERTAQCLDRTG